MRTNLQIAEELGRLVVAWRGRVLRFTDRSLLARLPTEEARDLLLDRFPGGVGSIGVLSQKGEKPEELLFSWKPRRG